MRAAQSIRLRMKQTVEGSWNGRDTQTFLVGKEYDFLQDDNGWQDLGRVFLMEKWAELVVKPVKTKESEAAPKTTTFEVTSEPAGHEDARRAGEPRPQGETEADVPGRTTARPNRFR